MGIKKRRIYTDFESVEKVLQKCTKKSYLQKPDGNMPFFQFYYVHQTLPITFFVCIFDNFFNGFEISVKFCVFRYLFWFKKKMYVILALFENCEAKHTKNGSKNKKNVFSKCVLDFNFAPIKGSVFFI